MNTQINVYLNFDGLCTEAMTFYKECLGGELTLQKVAESPMAAQLPSTAASRILHSSLINEHIVLMASDMMGAALVAGNNVALCMNAANETYIHLVFDRLSQGAKILTPLHQSFWGATYGELIDRFGIHWMFNYAKENRQ